MAEEPLPARIKYPHIVKVDAKPARLENHPRTRVAMIVADHIWHGWSGEEIVRQYPYLTHSEVYAALLYYVDHREEIETELLGECREADAWKKAHPTPEKLLRLKMAVA